MKIPICYLLIDDDSDEEALFQYALNKVDPDIVLHYSPSGQDAIKNLKEGIYKPNYIFLDLNMIPMNGIESLVEIKKIASCSNIPIIIYSLTINEEAKIKTSSLGAFGHFEKHIKQKDLEIYLKKLMHAN